jgi:hypothetical protein
MKRSQSRQPQQLAALSFLATVDLKTRGNLGLKAPIFLLTFARNLGGGRSDHSANETS